MRRIFLLFIFGINITFYAQNTDSTTTLLKEKINSTISDSLKIIYQYDLAKKIIKKNPEKGKKLFDNTLKIIEKQKKLTKHFLIYKARILKNTGRYYEKKGNYQEALKLHLSSLNISSKEKDSLNISYSNSSLGKLYRKLKQYKKARKYHKNALAIRKKLNLIKGQTRSLRYIAGTFYYTKQYDSSLVYFKEAKKISTFPKETARINAEYAIVLYKKTKNYKRAIDLFKENIDVFIKLNEYDKVAVTYQNLASVYSDFNNQKQALFYINQALKLNAKIDRRNTIDELYQIKSLIYERMGNHTESLKNYKLYKTYFDSINNAKKAKEIKQVEINYLFKKEKLELKFNAKSQEAKTKLYSTLLLVSLLLFILLFIFFYYRRKINLERIKKGQLEKELLDEQLKSSTYQTKRVIADNKMRSQFKQELIEQLKVLKNNKDLTNTDFQRFINDIQLQINTESKLDDLNNIIDEFDQIFTKKILTQYPSLTKGEREICSLIRLNLSLKEIMIIRNASINSIKSSRYRIRKKMKVPKETDLESFIQQLFLN